MKTRLNQNLTPAEAHARTNGLPAYAFGFEHHSIDEMQAEGEDAMGSVLFLSYRTDYAIVVRLDEEKDWNYYSKAWHRAHGPKVSKSNRRVEFYTRNATGVWTLRKTRTLTSFRGNWLIRAIVSVLKVPVATNQPGGRAVQLIAHARTERIRRVGGVVIYRRTLAGATLDYCATSTDEKGKTADAYHASTPADAVRGLRAKIRARAEKAEANAKGIVTYALAKKLGFCDTGITTFRAEFGLGDVDWIRLDDIAELVRQDPHAAAPYAAELRTLAEHFHRTDLIEEAQYALA